MTMRSNVARQPRQIASVPMSARSLNPGRRAKLEALQFREKSKAVKSRLLGIIAQRLIAKYGDRGVKMSGRNGVIEKTCEREIGNNMQPSTDDLTQLEAKVAMAVEAYNAGNGNDGSQPGSRMGGSRAGGRSSSKQSSKQSNESNGQRMMNSSNNGMSLTASSSAGALDSALASDPASLLASDWSLLDAYDMLEHNQKQKQKQEVALEERRRMVSDLDKQREELARRKEVEVEKARAYQVEVKGTIQQWQDEEDKKLEKHQAKLTDEKRAREAVIAARRAKLDQQREMKAAQEAADLARVKKEINDEEQARLDGIVTEKKRLEGIMRENAAEKVVREAKKLEQWEEDRVLMVEYAKKLEREEFARANAFKARTDKLQAMGQKFATEGAGAKAAEQEAQEREMIEEAYRKKIKADDDREARDIATKKRQAMLMKRDNLLLQNEKDKRKAKEDADTASFAALSMKELDRQNAAETAKKEAKKNAIKQNRNGLVEQARLRRESAASTNMTDMERALNADRLERLHANPDALATILSTLPTKASPTGKR